MRSVRDRWGLSKAVVGALIADLDTDWVPDPWGFGDLPSLVGMPLPEPSDLEPPPSLIVAMLGGRRRRVPILDSWTRVVLHQAARPVLEHVEGMLGRDVLAYRMGQQGCIEHYRSALARRRDVEMEYAAEHAVGLAVDIASFFPTVKLDLLDGLLGDAPGWPRQRELLAFFHESFGYILPEGYGPARALANAALIPLDAVIHAPFTRWVDDYRIFCDSKEEASDVLGAMTDQAASMGLRLSEGKTRIVSSTEFDTSGGSVVDHTIDQLDALRPDDGPVVGAADERSLRLTLRLAAERGDGRLLDDMLQFEPDQIPATAIPRLAWLIASTPWTDASTALIRNLCCIEDDLCSWRLARLGPAMWYSPPSEIASLATDVMPRLAERAVLHPLLSRLVAHHSPEKLDQLRNVSATAAWTRAFGLASHEASSVAWDAGPPVQTYL